MQLVLDWREVIACECEQDLFYDVVDLELFQAGLRCPEIPFDFRYNVAGVGKGGLALAVGIPADVIQVPVREDDGIYVSGVNPRRPQVLD